MDPIPLSALKNEIYQRRKKNIFDFYRMKFLKGFKKQYPSVATETRSELWTVDVNHIISDVPLFCLFLATDTSGNQGTISSYM